MAARLKHRLMRMVSILPDRFLCWAARKWDTPGAFECSVEGSSFWMDASYQRWARIDQRRHPLT